MGLKFNNVALKKMTHNGYKVKKWTHNGVKVWSGATVVSYYDGSRLIGTQEYEENQDVLHPSISLAKSGYVHTGWTYNGSNVTTLKANGNPMTVYATYIPYSLTVASGYLGGDRYYGSVNTSYGTYVSGSLYAHAEAPSSVVDDTTGFTLSFGRYRSASCSFVTYRKNNADVYVDWRTDISNITTLSAGYHYLRATAQNDEGEASATVGIGSITLSNPTGWT